MISEHSNSITYKGDGSTVAFTYPFDINNESDIHVIIVAADGGQEEITTGYTVNKSTKTVTYPGYASGSEPDVLPSPLSTDETICIYSLTPVAQEVDLPDKWPYDRIEAGMDKLTIIEQQNRAMFDRAIIMDYTADYKNVSLKLPTPTPNKVIVWDSTGTKMTLDDYPSDMREQCEGAAASATASATAAASSATESATSATNAAASATTATTEAEAAGTSATAAAGSATEAAGKVTACQAVVDGAIEDIKKVARAVGLPIGTIIPYSSNGDYPNGFLLCDGASVSRTMYPDLFAVIGTTYGAVDDEHFSLPDLTDKFIEGASTAGTEKSAGLPNIEGTLGSCASFNNSSATGALGVTDIMQTGASSTSRANSAWGFDFDASRSSAIYGNSTTVQPPALTMRYIIKAFDGQTADSALIDVTQYANELALKVNKSEADYVVDSGTSTDGTMWYRKWKSGWLEQGGVTGTCTSDYHGLTVNLLKEMKETNYNVLLTPTDKNLNNTNVVFFCISCSSKTNTSFKCYGNASYINGMNWYACGQGADE